MGRLRGAGCRRTVPGGRGVAPAQRPRPRPRRRRWSTGRTTWWRRREREPVQAGHRATAAEPAGRVPGRGRSFRHRCVRRARGAGRGPRSRPRRPPRCRSAPRRIAALTPRVTGIASITSRPAASSSASTIGTTRSQSRRSSSEDGGAASSAGGSGCTVGGRLGSVVGTWSPASSVTAAWVPAPGRTRPADSVGSSGHQPRPSTATSGQANASPLRTT